MFAARMSPETESRVTSVPEMPRARRGAVMVLMSRAPFQLRGRRMTICIQRSELSLMLRP